MIALAVVTLALPAAAGSTEEERLLDCGVALKQALDVPEQIPQSLLDKAECVIVIPSVKKAAFFVGALHGPFQCSPVRHDMAPRP